MAVAPPLPPMSYALSSFNLREKQTLTLVSLLNFNRDKDKEASDGPEWKVLVLDSRMSDVVAPLLRVVELRKLGVTLHLPLHSARLPLPEVPAIYLLSPTAANLDRVAQDCAAQLYASVSLNFSSSLGPHELERLAEATVRSGSAQLIRQVYEQHIDFVTLEKDLFTLNMENSYRTFNSPKVAEAAAQEAVGTVVEALYGVVLTLGAVPVIRCPRAPGAAQLVATALEARLAAALTQPGAAGGSSLASHLVSSLAPRPLLLLVDRNVDLATMAGHPWTYQALVHDLLDMKLNRVRLPGQAADNSNALFDLDSAADTTWEQLRGALFPEVGIAVKEQVDAYSARMREVDAVREGAGTLQGLVAAVPELQAQQARLQRHMEIASALLGLINNRDLHELHMLETAIVQRRADRRAILQALGPEARSPPEDKLRLLILWALCCDASEKSDVEAAARQLPEGTDTRALQWCLRVRAFNESLSAASGSAEGSGGMGGLSGAGARAVSATVLSLFNSAVKALGPTGAQLPLSRLLEALLEPRPAAGSSATQDFLYLDPRMPRSAAAAAAGRAPPLHPPFKDGIVFVLGGGNYVEYGDVQEMARNRNKRLIYGCTELLNPRAFLSQAASCMD